MLALVYADAAWGDFLPFMLLDSLVTQLEGDQLVYSSSLVPRPLPPPVFDHLQYANIEKEGLGGLVTCGYIR